MPNIFSKREVLVSNKRLKSKNVLITGGNSGIGQAIALSYAKEGANVIITYNTDQSTADATLTKMARYGVRAKAIQINLSKTDCYDSLLEESLNFFKQIDVLVNNVGVLTRTSFVDIAPEQFDYVLTTNLRAPFFLTQKIAKHMIKENIKGSIINVSSLSSESAVSRVAHYQCSKAALAMLTKSAAYELAPHQIRVNTLSPGLTATKGNRNQWELNPEVWKERSQHIPLERTGTPEDHAAAAIFLASDESSWVTGINIIIDGGQSTI